MTIAPNGPRLKIHFYFPLCVHSLLTIQCRSFNFQHYFIAGYNFNSDSDSNTEKAILFYHRVVEAFKFAFARRSELGDNATDDVSVLQK